MNSIQFQHIQREVVGLPYSSIWGNEFYTVSTHTERSCWITLFKHMRQWILYSFNTYREKLLDYLIQAYEAMNSIQFQHIQREFVGLPYSSIWGNEFYTVSTHTERSCWITLFKHMRQWILYSFNTYREKLLDYLIQAYEAMNSIQFQHKEKNGDKQKRGKGEVFLSGLALMWHKRYIYINCELWYSCLHNYNRKLLITAHDSSKSQGMSLNNVCGWFQ